MHCTAVSALFWSPSMSNVIFISLFLFLGASPTFALSFLLIAWLVYANSNGQCYASASGLSKLWNYVFDAFDLAVSSGKARLSSVFYWKWTCSFSFSCEVEVLVCFGCDTGVGTFKLRFLAKSFESDNVLVWSCLMFLMGWYNNLR